MPTFYHYSSQRLETLEPRVGSARHAGEDSRAVDKAVVWLNSRPLDCCEYRGSILSYCHTVEIDSDDPNLHLDEPFAQLMEKFASEFGASSESDGPWRWYFYTGSIPVNDVKTWNGQEYA